LTLPAGGILRLNASTEESMADTETAPSGAGASRLATTLLALNTLLLAAVLGLTLRSMSAKPATAHAAMALPSDGKHEGGEGGENAKHDDGATGGEHGAAAPKPTTLKLSDIVVQLRDTEVDRYAKFSFELELRSELDVAALTPLLPRARESFISYLSDRSLDELRGSEGIERAKRELLQRIEAVYPGKHVKGVIISDFVSQ
jgi:flagellar FliL protein